MEKIFIIAIACLLILILIGLFFICYTRPVPGLGFVKQLLKYLTIITSYLLVVGLGFLGGVYYTYRKIDGKYAINEEWYLHSYAYTKGTWTLRYLGAIIIIVYLCLFALKMIAFIRVGKGGRGDKTGNGLSSGDKVN